MKEFNVSITSTTRRRALKSGTIAAYPQYYCEYKDLLTGKRRRRAFNRKKDVEAFRNALLVKVAEGNYVDEHKAPTVSISIDHWLTDRESKVKASTLKGYKTIVNGAIRGPLLIGTKQQRADYTEKGIAPKGASFLSLLGDIKLTDLTTATIRIWHKTIVEQCGTYTANRAKGHLKSILALAEEDFSIRAPSIPTGLAKVRHKGKKAILTPQHIAALLAAAKDDPEHGIYYAFPFLAGTRPSEQLGLLWSEVDFDRNVIHICRIQERDGTLTEMTKTEAGTRDIPMSAALREMLLAWRIRCPRKRQGTAPCLPRPRSIAGMAASTPWRRRAAALPELPQALLGSRVQGAGYSLCNAAFGAAFFHLDLAGIWDRGWACCPDRWTCKPCGHAWSLHTGRTRRQRRHRSPRQGIHPLNRHGGRQRIGPPCPADRTSSAAGRSTGTMPRRATARVRGASRREGVRDKRTGAEDWIPIERAAVLMGMEAYDIDAALEEFGECEVEDFIALDPE